ncbi:MAG TPA: protein kinase [Acidobacteriaceae bacterium]|nr:protein kinase [Acidobacteriaceae bacterium]
MPLRSGSTVGEYTIIGSLGAGGMGEVYRARDPRLERDVAIKVLPGLSCSDAERLERFEQEARAAAALNHPNILAVFQLGSFEGAPYLVSELLEGETLRDRLNRGVLPLRGAIDVGVQIARGLAAAHKKGIVHRDLKPENIFLTKDGHAKILDFGLARMVPIEGESALLAHTLGPHTSPGVLMGTVGYMSPEQVRQKPADARSDIFSLCVILCEMLTGKLTFSKPTSAETMTAILHEDPPSLAVLATNTPPALQRLLQRGLEKDPDCRFHSASDLAFALEALSDPAMSGPVAHSKGPRVQRRRSRMPWVVAGLVVLAGLGTAAYLAMRSPGAPVVGRYVQLTHDGAQKTIIGTDGARLYLTLVNSGVEDVATIPVSGGALEKVPMPGPTMMPVDLSPDGLQFLAVNGTGFPAVGPLWSVPVLGGSPRRLGDTEGDSAAWSPDGRSLAYANRNTLFVARADGSQARKILTLPALISAIVWSPDGKSLRFGTAALSSDISEGGIAGNAVGGLALWQAGADGNNLHRLLEGWHEASDPCCGRWTPDGKYFLFAAGGQIWSVPSGRFLNSVTTPVQLTDSPMSLNSPLVGQYGKKLYVVGRTYRGELAYYDAKAGHFSPFLGGISAEWVDVSRDGQWVTYVSYPEGMLWKSRVDGSDALQLTFTPLRPVLPRWSPDGKTIAFFEFPVSATHPGHMYVVSADGGSPRALIPTDPHNEQDPTWSPDGNKIVFAGDANDAAMDKSAPAIHLLDLRTGEVSSLQGSNGLFSPRWSPDGKFIAAMSSDSSRLMLYDLATQQWTEIARGTFGWLNWSADSRSLYVLDYTGKGFVIRIGIRDHKVERVADLKDFSGTGQAGAALSLGPHDAPVMLRDRGTQDVYALDWKAP